MSHIRGSSLLLSLTAVLAAGVLVPGSAAAAPEPDIVVLSNRADLVSGGDALVEVTPPDADIEVELNGRDVTDAFALRENGRRQGLVTGLRSGANTLTATTGRRAARLTITNHSEQGPIIAGPQIQPWVCETEAFGLGPATGPDCVAPIRYDYFYKSTATGTFESYDPAAPPADDLVARTTTDQGRSVPYVVRRERGVLDRTIYDLTVLYEPGRDWQPWRPQPAWNGKLHWLMEGGVGPWHRQAMGTGPVNALDGGVANVTYPSFGLGDLALSRGFAVASTSGTRANYVLAAEIMMLLKERVVERYGPIRYTMSNGCSGGSAGQYQIANNYPGLLDGIMPMCSTLDTWTVRKEAVDYVLLGRYFDKAPAGLWPDPAARAAVSGMKDDVACQSWARDTQRMFFDPTVGCTQTPTSTVPEPDWVYRPDTNPGGVRCTYQDWQAAVLGHRDDGFANRPWDNVGVQYGLDALRHGQIDAEQFVDLNAGVGGHDIDFTWTPARTEADREGLRNLYRGGLVTDGQRLDRVPIMDVRGGLNEEIHTSLFTTTARARMIAANGHADNLVSWRSANTVFLPGDGALLERAFTTLDAWLAGIEADHSGAPLETKVLRHKPALARDICWSGGVPNACDLPDYRNPRLVAGSPVANDVFKCELRAIDWRDYPVRFTGAQRARLRAAFPDGVCDWTRPGVAQQPSGGPWLTFATGPGGTPLGPPPHAR